jgi:hypothetical protein
MRIAVALAALAVAGTPDVNKLILAPSQVGTGYVLFHRADGVGVKNTVTLDLCGRKGYPSEALRVSRLQVNYAAPSNPLGLSNEVVAYRPGGAVQAMREVAHHADHCPNRPILTGEAGLPPLRFTITRISDARLLRGYVAVRIRVRGTVKLKVKGKLQARKVDQTSYAVYQRLGNVLSGTYSYGPNTSAQQRFALKAAEQSAQNLRRGHNVGSPTA